MPTETDPQNNYTSFTQRLQEHIKVAIEKDMERIQTDVLLASFYLKNQLEALVNNRPYQKIVVENLLKRLEAPNEAEKNRAHTFFISQLSTPLEFKNFLQEHFLITHANNMSKRLKVMALLDPQRVEDTLDILYQLTPSIPGAQKILSTFIMNCAFHKFYKEYDYKQGFLGTKDSTLLFENLYLSLEKTSEFFEKNNVQLEDSVLQNTQSDLKEILVNSFPLYRARNKEFSSVLLFELLDLSYHYLFKNSKNDFDNFIEEIKLEFIENKEERLIALFETIAHKIILDNHIQANKAKKVAAQPHKI